ncbi:MAG: hypothetical protein K2O28_01750 [Clostridia bacterium]|nr:hypothetical protein [Clostridia bacterium]
MKDKRLEEQFKGYFEGVEIPELPNNIVADAKKSVKRRDIRLPRFAKIASIAASFVLVFAVAAVLIARADFTVVQPEGGNQSGSAGAPPTASTYTADALLDPIDKDVYALSTDDENYKSLKFLKTLAYKPNAEVTEMQTYSFKDSGEIAHVYAEVTLISGARYDATVYVEFTEETFDELKDYSSFKTGTYRGLSYRLETVYPEDEEPVNKLYVEKDGVKYYFNIQSSDENSYIKCLELLLQK